MKSRAAILLLAASLANCAPAPAPDNAAAHQAALAAAIAAPTRTEANRARDLYRHPYETLAFFGVEPDDTVVEVWPGGGWYTEILAPYLAGGRGTLYVAAPDWGRSGIAKLQQANAA